MLDIRSTELNLIPIFVAIYEERSLSRAATRMEISQPAVSKALKRLREIYDDPLFHRKVAGMEPTSFAIDIYPAMAAALKNFSSTLSTSRAFNPHTSQRVFSIACITLVSARLIPALLCKIRQQAPGIALEVHPLFTEDMESDLRMQRYDLIIDMTQSGRSMLKSEVLYAEQVKVVCASDHPRLGSDLTVEAYFTEEHVALAQWQVRGSMITAEHLPQMANRNIVVRVPSAMEMLPIIARSEIIGVLPHSTIETFAGIYDVRVLPFPFDESVFSLSAIWHPSRTAEAGHRWLRQQLFEVVSELGLTPSIDQP
ncbi:LysR family transcriptional regulator [Aeromonas allosaccharophila]|uniref:LysR family transcriptional regulator n=1 Tax=Aeromonas allosaccharophila TaxID=656 RepID=UPI0005B22299|nr:LysR family transcriptional regulator [Aeromonas allosaccharophila]